MSAANGASGEGRMPFPMFLYRLLPFGRESELLGMEYLRSLGYRVVASSYRTQDGEVDIIAWDGEVLTFVEVKSLSAGGSPEDAVGARKRQRNQCRFRFWP